MVSLVLKITCAATLEFESLRWVWHSNRKNRIVAETTAHTGPLERPLDGVEAAWQMARHWVAEIVEWFGAIGIFCWQVFRAAITPPFELRELIHQMDEIGAKSLPLISLAGAATGVVLALQTHDSLVRFGAISMLPTVIIFSLVRETGPVITGLIASGRVGAGIGAELGSMKVTEQIDAMEVSAVDPYKYLAATRVVACILMQPLLTLAADFCGVFFGWIASTLQNPISLQYFIHSGMTEMGFNDFLPPTFKTAIFGFIIGAVSCFFGMNTRGGTEGVGRSATRSVVVSSLFIVVADVALVRVIAVLFS